MEKNDIIRITILIMYKITLCGSHFKRLQGLIVELFNIRQRSLGSPPDEEECYYSSYNEHRNDNSCNGTTTNTWFLTFTRTTIGWTATWIVTSVSSGGWGCTRRRRGCRAGVPGVSIFPDKIMIKLSIIWKPYGVIICIWLRKNYKFSQWECQIYSLQVDVFQWFRDPSSETVIFNIPSNIKTNTFNKSREKTCLLDVN